jgi:hypothetical protein
MTHSRKFAFAALVFLAACQHRPPAGAVTSDEARALLLNRNWLDVAPKHRDDKLRVFRFVPDMGGGVYQDRTLFFGTFELFRFQASGDEIVFDLVHTNETRRSRYYIERIKPAAPGDFDLRLTLGDSPRGPSVYYGWQAEAGDYFDKRMR